jgi:hypothetical protein
MDLVMQLNKQLDKQREEHKVIDWNEIGFIQEIR